MKANVYWPIEDYVMSSEKSVQKIGAKRKYVLMITLMNADG